MTVKAALAALGVTLSITVTQGAFAGDFSVHCRYTNENMRQCASLISDVVTDKFIAKFPAAQFQIFAYSHIVSFTNGGFAAHAIAGVIPKNSGQFPNLSFSSTKSNGTGKMFSRVEIAEQELDTYRAAVKNLMDECEISPSCDVYMARETKRQ